jgi:multidrug resistance protein
MAGSKTDSVITENTLEADHHSTSTPTESTGSDIEKPEHEAHEKTLEHNTEPPRRGSIDSDVEHGISLVNPVEDKDEEGGAQGTITEHDPNVVDWDSPDDPERAMNWTNKKKWTNQAIIACVTFLTPLASSMVAPGVPEILHDFNTTNETIGALVVSIYILGYALGPLFIAPMSEVYGRLITYHVNNILFVVWTIACALAPNVGALLAFRVLAGIAGSCPITIGGGSIADLFKQEQRGAAMALFALGPLMGPVIGPVAGGYLAQAKGWRWVFWVIAIAGGAACTCSITFMRETYEPVLLQRKVNRLRKETGNQKLRSKLDSGLPVRAYFIRALVRPTKMLFLSPIVLALSIYMAVVYGYLYLLFTTLTLVFEHDYGFSGGNVGLVFLGIGVGSLLGLFIFGMASDKIVKRMSAKGEMKPEYRLPPLIPGSMVIPIGLFWYGWSAEAHIHWIMPIIGTMFVGLGLLATFMPIQTYLVDAFTIHAASAIAANTVLRSLVGAFLPLAGPKMYAALGLGWGNSLLAFIAIALAPISWIFFKYGERIRKSPRFQVTF